MKTCSTCNKNQDDTEFVLKNKRTGTRASKCNSCHRIYLKEHYKKNKHKYIKTAAAFTNKVYERNKQYIYEYLKDHPCTVCGESDVLVLEFDHRDPNTKKEDISTLIRSYSLKSLNLEIDKCDVLCANCHRRKTHKERNTFKYQKTIAV